MVIRFLYVRIYGLPVVGLVLRRAQSRQVRRARCKSGTDEASDAVGERTARARE